MNGAEERSKGRVQGKWTHNINIITCPRIGIHSSLCNSAMTNSYTKKVTALTGNARSSAGVAPLIKTPMPSLLYDRMAQSTRPLYGALDGTVECPCRLV